MSGLGKRHCTRRAASLAEAEGDSILPRNGVDPEPEQRSTSEVVENEEEEESEDDEPVRRRAGKTMTPGLAAFGDSDNDDSDVSDMDNIPDIDLTNEVEVSVGTKLLHKDLGECEVMHTGIGTMYASSEHVQVEFFSITINKTVRRWVRRADLRPRTCTSTAGASSSASARCSQSGPSRGGSDPSQASIGEAFDEIMFGPNRSSSLADQIQASLLLRYNNNKREQEAM